MGLDAKTKFNPNFPLQTRLERDSWICLQLKGLCVSTQGALAGIKMFVQMEQKIWPKMG